MSSCSDQARWSGLCRWHCARVLTHLRDGTSAWTGNCCCWPLKDVVLVVLLAVRRQVYARQQLTGSGYDTCIIWCTVVEFIVRIVNSLLHVMFPMMYFFFPRIYNFHWIWNAVILVAKKKKKILHWRLQVHWLVLHSHMWCADLS